MKRVVVASGTDNIDELAQRADGVLGADSATYTTSRRHENQNLAPCDPSLKEKVNELIDSVNKLVNCSQNPEYQLQLFLRSCSPRYKKSNGGKILWPNPTFSTPQKMNPKQLSSQNKSPEHGWNPDQGLLVHKVFLAIHASHFQDLRLLFAQGMKPHELVLWGV